MKPSSLPYSIFALIVISTLLLGAAVPQPAAAGPSAQADGVRYDYSHATGALTFVGADPSQPVAVAGVSGVGALSAEDQALGIIDQYADALGLSNPSQELRLEKAESFDNRTMLRYQQVYRGIPVMGGDLILNTQGEGYLLSLSGEVSPELSLDTATQLTAEQASAIALQAMQKWYPDEQATFTTSEPELWIYDPRLLENRDGPIVLGWRMEVTSEGISLPMRELVLVDAKTGNVPLHVNQIDTGWTEQMQDPAPTDTPTETPLPTETLEPPATPLLTETPVPTELPTEGPAEPQDVGALVATPRYVSTTGTDSGDCSNSVTPCLTINYAIGQALMDDTIFVATGVFTGVGDQVVLLSKSVTLSGGWDAAFGARVGLSMIDGQAVRRGVVVNSAVTAVITHFTVQNGFRAPSVLGGGILNRGSLTILDSTIVGNRTEGASGGGIWTDGTLTLDHTTVEGNVAEDFGTTVVSGGGISGRGILTLNNSSVVNNTASFGAGISFSGATLILNNSTVSMNVAEDHGLGAAGIETAGGTVQLNNATVARNQGGAGIYVEGGSVSLQNSMVAQNEEDCSGTVYSIGHNLIGNTSGCTVSAGPGDLFNVDPLLGPLVTVSGYHLLLAGSPAIDGGNPATCSSTDQRGMSRPQGSACDIGSYEFAPSPGPAVSIGVAEGSGQHAAPSTDFAKPLSVYVLDALGSGVGGVSVTFTAPGSGASGIFADTGTNTTTVITDSGTAVAPSFTANSENGDYSVTATASGLPGSVDFALTNSAWLVASTGNDANACLSAVAPCRTINAAINKASPGDTILVAAGTYAGSGSNPVVTISKSVILLGGGIQPLPARTISRLSTDRTADEL